MESFYLLKLNVFTVILIFVSSQRLNFQKSLEGKHFNYYNCNRTAVPLYVKFLNISPDPIRMGDAINVTLNFDLERDAGVNHNRIEVDFSLRLKTKEGYTELCDVIGEEACHYNDFCAVLAEYMENRKCPWFIPRLFRNNCSCPFLKRDYNCKFPITFRLPRLSFEIRGTFDMTMNIHEQGKYLGCVEIHFCLTNCEPLGSEKIRTKSTDIFNNSFT